MILTNATVVTMDPQRRILQGDVRVAAGRIAEIGPGLRPSPEEPIRDLRGKVLIPGLIQGHVHLCQTLFRNVAEELSLLDWLRTRIWPLEGGHNPSSLYATARLGIAELLGGGTTTILDMGTVHHTEAVFEAARESGIRAVIGKAMMDAGQGVPPSLQERTDASLKESFDLMERWQGAEGGRLGYALAPRFVPSCSPALLAAVAEAMSRGARVHTHASEMLGEIELVRSLTGMENLEYLHSLGLLSSSTTLAHCVWVEEGEMDLLVAAGAHVAHCPGSNLKLSSGIAPIPRYLERGISVCLGSDGAPCNNRLDTFEEMRLAGLIQKPIHGPRAMPARAVFELATLGGAAAVGLSEEIGSIEVGKRADLVALDLRGSGAWPAGDLYACLVYTADRRAVDAVWVDGELVAEGGRLTRQPLEETLALVDAEAPGVFRRAGLDGLWEAHLGGL